MPQGDDRLRSMFLSGTVSIPPRFPDIADISFAYIGEKSPMLAVEVTSELSAKLTIKRTFFIEDVTCIFVPDDEAVVDLKKGKWYQGEEVSNKAAGGTGKTAMKGIVYVRENAQSLLDVQAGLTAAESAEYYPPLPDDRSVNHYCMDKGAGGEVYRAGCPF